MKKRIMVILAVLLMLLLTVQPLQAQDGGEEETTEELIALVLAANDNLYAAQFFEFDAIQTQEQVIGSGVGLRRLVLNRETVLQVESAAVQVDETGRPIAFEAEMLQEDTRLVNNLIRSDGNIVMEYELRLVDDADLYVRINSIDGAINDDAIETVNDEAVRTELQEQFMTGWVNVSANAQQLADDLNYLNSAYSDINFFDSLNLQAILDLNAGITWTAENVDSIVERASDDAAIRLFEVEINPTTLFAASNLTGLVDDDALAGDAGLMLEEMFNGTSLTQRVSVEIDDEGVPILSRIETVMTIDVVFSDGSDANEDATDATDGVPLDLQMETTTTINYDRIGSEFEVVAPEPELSVNASCDPESLAVVFEITNSGANMEAAAPYTISREGELPDEAELMLEAGSFLRIEREDGIFTFDLPFAEINQTIECIEVVEEESDDAS